jgi:hypothetical protein
MGRAYSMHGAKNAYRGLMGKPEGKRHACRLAYNIKMDLRYDGVVWTGFIWLRILPCGGLS